jgi:hypothetical protein
MIGPILIGEAVFEKNPFLLENLWQFDSKVWILGSGLPRGLPVPGLTAGYIARNKLLKTLTNFLQALDNDRGGRNAGSEWQDLTDVSNIIVDAERVLAQDNIPFPDRAPYTLYLLWSLVAKTSTVIFWILLHIYSQSEVLEKVRAEIRSYVRATQPPQEFSIPEPPRLEFDLVDFDQDCPTLKACYIETLRLYSNQWDIQKVQRDFFVSMNLQEENNNVFKNRYHIPQSQFAYTAYRPHHLDPHFYRAPDRWIPERHLLSKDGVEGLKKTTVKGLSK